MKAPEESGELRTGERPPELAQCESSFVCKENCVCVWGGAVPEERKLDCCWLKSEWEVGGLRKKGLGMRDCMAARRR